MKNNEIILFITVLSCLLFGCNISYETPDKIVLPDAIQLNGQTIQIDNNLLNPMGMCISDDKLIIFDDVQTGLFNVFKIPEPAYMFSWGSRGKGPEEFLVINNNYIRSFRNELELLDNGIFKRLAIMDDRLKIESIKRLPIMENPINGLNRINDSIYFADNFFSDGSNEHLIINVNTGNILNKFGNYPNHYNKLRGGYIGGRFFVDKGYIFMSMPGFDGSISMLPLWNNLDVRSFGEVIPFSSERQTRFQNHRHVFLHKNFFISVSRTHPMIEKYSKEGDLIEIFSYRNLPLLEELNQYKQSQPSVENVTINVVHDAYLNGDLLYLLLYTRENERPYVNKILVLNLGGGNIKFEKLLDIGPGRFTAIGASEEYIWAFRSDRHMMYLSRFPIENFIQ